VAERRGATRRSLDASTPSVLALSFDHGSRSGTGRRRAGLDRRDRRQRCQTGADTHRIRDTIRPVEENSRDIGRYLEATIHAGLYCVYKPL